MFNTVSPRDLQRGAKKVMEKANKLGKPIIVITKNKPVGAVIGLDLLWKLETLLNLMYPTVDEETEKRIGQSLKDIEEGRYTVISTGEELDKHLSSL